jgi:hypothetical protein
VVASITWGESRADVDRDVAMLQAAGARYIRTNVNWSALEPDGKGTISSSTLGEYDYAIDRARAAGIKIIMPVADGVPYWASADPAKYIDAAGVRRWDKFYPPANYADYGDIVRFVVSHFAGRGVHVYEMWNEPNLAYFWSSGPDAAEYVKMLKAGYTAAKTADPSSTVLLGGLSGNDFEYLDQVYRAGGGPYFDAAAVHPYTYGVDPTVAWKGANADEDHERISKYAFPGLKEIRRTMEAHGDSAKGVWITEFGYSTTASDGGVSEETQAAYLTKAYKYVERFPWVKTMLWYSARNTPWNADADDYESRFGLATTDWRPKPSYEAFKAYAASAPSGFGKPVLPSLLGKLEVHEVLRALVVAAPLEAGGLERLDERLGEVEEPAPGVAPQRVRVAGGQLLLERVPVLPELRLLRLQPPFGGGPVLRSGA